MARSALLCLWIFFYISDFLGGWERMSRKKMRTEMGILF